MKKASMKRRQIAGKIAVYVILLLITALMIVPFLWMLSASIKSNNQVFQITPFNLFLMNPAGIITREYGQRFRS